MSHPYVNAHFPKPYMVLGNILKPFSLGHLLILKELDSPFTDESQQRDVSFEQLVAAAIVCTSTFEETIVMINDGVSFDKEKIKISDEIKNQLANNLSGSMVIQDATFAFAEYVTSNFKEPPAYVIETEGSGLSSGTYWIQTYINIICTECGYTRSEAWNLPIDLAIQEYLWYVEREGNIRLLTEQELELIKEMEEMNKKKEPDGI